MGFLADLVEDVEAITNVKKWGPRKLARVLGLVVVIGFVFAASGHLGDTIKDLLSTRGLSPFSGVNIDMLVQEQDPYQFDDADYDHPRDEKRNHDDDELRALASGKVTPCKGATMVVLKLYRTDRPAEKRPDEWTQQFWTDADCRWRAPDPFHLVHLGAYELEAHVHRSWHDIGGTTELLKRIHPTGVEKSEGLVERSGTQAIRTNTGHVTVVYLGESNFNRRVFERELLELNKRMQSFEVQVATADAEGPTCAKDKKATCLDKDCFASLRGKYSGPGVVVGIVANTLEVKKETETEVTTWTNLYSVYDESQRHLILSSNQKRFFNGRSSPSIYKYLLTFIVAAGATSGRDKTIPVSYHHDVTRGCIFDYDADKVRAQIGVEMGYLCEEHRQSFRKLKMAPEAFKDLTEGLPLTWLK